jgi:DNA-binding XRE family transcriptional regulator
MMTPEQVKHLRHTLNLTQAELAKALGVDIQTVKFWEAGRRNPGPVPTAKMTTMLQPGKVRAARLSDSLSAAADLADANAAAAIADGDPESAERTMRISGHLRRLAGAHQQMGETDTLADPVQIASPKQT